MYTDDQAVEIAPRILAMMQTPGWTDFCEVIKTKIQLTQEAAIADDPEKLLYHRGSIDGLRAAVLSAQDVLTTAQNITGELKEAKRRRQALSL